MTVILPILFLLLVPCAGSDARDGFDQTRAMPLEDTAQPSLTAWPFAVFDSIRPIEHLDVLSSMK